MEESEKVPVIIDVIEPPTPIRRSDLEETSIIIAEEISRFVNRVIAAPDGIINIEQCKQVSRFVTEYFSHWYKGNYAYAGCSVTAPWFEPKTAKGASYFNVTVDIYESEPSCHWPEDRDAADCIMTFRVASESADFGNGVVETRWVTERKYVWYES